MSPLLALKEINFRYPDQRELLIHDLNLDVFQGEIIALTGESGCGKSTLCYIACGVIPQLIHKTYAGHVYVKGKAMDKMSMAEISKSIGVVFQNPDHQLFSSTVVDELAFGMENHCYPREEMKKRIKKISKQLGLTDLLNENPNQLSGGQKQLVVLGSILCMAPDILILDEAFSQLSTDLRAQILCVLEELKKQGKGILIIDHQLDDLQVVDRYLFMKDGRLRNLKGEDGWKAFYA